LGLSLLLAGPALADKESMPDLGQIEQTCLPTATANLIIWFGTHGYPKLIAKGDSEDDGYIHTVHGIMNDTDARFDWGTRQDKVTVGIEKYIRDAGYNCDVEYRGLDYGEKDQKPPAAFTKDWLKDNDDANKGFILLLAYCSYNPQNGVFSNAWEAGHAVTLVDAEPDTILIHDPAHDVGEIGRKVLTPQELNGGTWQEEGHVASVSGLMLLSGSMLEAPPNAGVLLSGAVCITMHPLTEPGAPASKPATGPNATLASPGATANSPAAPTPATPTPSPLSTPAKPTSATTGWVMWFFDLLFSK